MTQPITTFRTLSLYTNALDGITCREPLDVELLNKLIRSDLLLTSYENPYLQNTVSIKTEEKLLSEYKTQQDPDDPGYVLVSYNRAEGMEYGRVYPEKMVGLAVMRVMIRHTLLHNHGFGDYDMKNAHYTVLYQMCKAFGWEKTFIEKYVNERAEIMKQVAEACSCSEGDVKALFTRILYFGTVREWMENTKTDDGKWITLESFPTEVMEFIGNLETELKKIAAHIFESNPDLVKKVEKNKEIKKKSKGNLRGSVVSFYLQEIESRILECAYQYCVQQNYIRRNVCSLVFDGIMLEMKWLEGKDICAELNAVVKSQYGFDITWVQKPMNESKFDVLDDHLLTIERYPLEMRVRFYAEFFRSRKSYQDRKLYFEMFCTKVRRPDPVYIWSQNNPNEIDQICMFAPSKLVEAFAELKTGETHSNGEPEKFLTRWMKDEDLKCCDTLDFCPGDCEPNIYNLFRGFNPLKDSPFDKENRVMIVKPFKDVLFQICGADQKSFDWQYNFFADIIQNPGRKFPFLAIWKGIQGTGKSLVLGAVGKLLGREHYISSDRADDFFGAYAEGFYHKLLVNLNEIEGKNTVDFAGKIKAFVTEEWITMNPKFVRAKQIRNFARVIVTTQNENPLQIDALGQDRRFVVFRSTDYFRNPKYGSAFWDGMAKRLSTPEFLAALY